MQPFGAKTLEELAAEADRAMYAAKQARQKRPRKGTVTEQQAELDLAYRSGKIAS